jgi:Na+-translocating ferredoxin:NAD+ oxidoreductase subunit G
MNASVKMVLSLTVISVLAGGILQAWESYTKPMIEHNAAEKIKIAVGEVLPPYDSYEEKKSGDLTLYIGKKTGQEEPEGVAFLASGNGFQGPLGIMVGLKGDLSEITGIKVISQAETPGLGDKIRNDPSNRENPFWFSAQFKGISTDAPVKVLKNQKPSGNTEIQAITGATISSKAVSRIVSEYYTKVRAALPEYLKPKETISEDSVNKAIQNTAGKDSLQKKAAEAVKSAGGL